MIRFTFTVAAMFFALTSAISSTPEPGDDPMRPTIPVLYLSTAGKFPLTETRLTSFTEVKVCDNDYPSGWTIRCGVVSKTSVIFRINGAIFKKEYFAPYYLSGNWKAGSQVGAFDMGSNTRLRIACRVRTRKSVWVDIVKSC